MSSEQGSGQGTNDSPEQKLELVYSHRGTQHRSVSPVTDYKIDNGVLIATIGYERQVVLSPGTEWCIEPKEWDAH